MKWSERQNKASTRTRVLETAYKILGVAPADNVLMIPGSEALCVIEAYKLGLIHDETDCSLVERDASIANKTVDSIIKSAIKIKATVHRNELTNIVFPKTEKFDFVYLDLCNTVNEKLIDWIEKLRDNLSDVAVIATNNFTKLRGNSEQLIKFHKEQVPKQNHGHVPEELLQQLYTIKPEWLSMLLSPTGMNCLTTTTALFNALKNCQLVDSTIYKDSRANYMISNIFLTTQK